MAIRITESQLRRIVREERARLQEIDTMGHDQFMALEGRLFDAMEQFYAVAAGEVGHERAVDMILDLAAEFAEDYR